MKRKNPILQLILNMFEFNRTINNSRRKIYTKIYTNIYKISEGDDEAEHVLRKHETCARESARLLVYRVYIFFDANK